MTRRTIGRAAFLVAAGLLLFTSAPMPAAETANGDAAALEQPADAGKPLALIKEKKARTQKVSRSRKARIAVIKGGKRKANEARQAKIDSRKKDEAAPEKEIPAAVANANAQMTGVDARGQAAVTGTTPMEMAAADQFNELDKSLATPQTDDEPRRITTELVVNDQPQSAMPVATPEPPRPATQMSSASSGDAWAQSSLIGKIFIAFGGLLTLASAARMLVA